MKKTLLVFLLALSLSSCGQVNNNRLKNNNTEVKMDLSIITNENVMKAIEALQANDKKAWYAHFTDNATFTDDGRTMNFKSFFDNAFDKKEMFLDIDTVANEGKDIYGNFYAGQWGAFRVYFKFHQNKDGKFDRLDIGQAAK